LAFGNIIDNSTFAIIFENMNEKETNHQETTAENIAENQPGIDINADSDVPGTGHLSNPEQQGELDSLHAEIAEWKDKYLRQVAEFDNFRKRSARERLELLQTAGKDVIIPLLEVLDDCDRAQTQLSKSEDIVSLKEGLQLVFTKLRNTLQARGLKAMETKGQDFNPDLHEAITQIPAPTEALKEKVIDEVEKGYLLNDKIIRFAKVVVGK
jgi:molecular chaperone GrpE